MTSAAQGRGHGSSRFRRLRCWLMVIGVGWGVPQLAWAYCRTTTCDNDVNADDPSCTWDSRGCATAGEPLVWSKPCASFSVAASGSPLRGIGYERAVEAIGTALSLWVEADCMPGRPNMQVVLFDPYECESAGYSRTGPNANSWVFRDEDWPDELPYGERTLALTTVTSNPVTGEIVDVDVEINSKAFSLTEEDDSLLAAVALHEAGHFFGLADLYSVQDAEATMYGYYTPSLGFGQGLSQDDIEGICAVYPPSDDPLRACDPTPRRGFSAGCPSEHDSVDGCQCMAGRAPAGGVAHSLGLLALAAALGRLRRQRLGPSPDSEQAGRYGGATRRC